MTKKNSNGVSPRFMNSVSRLSRAVEDRADSFLDYNAGWGGTEINVGVAATHLEISEGSCKCSSRDPVGDDENLSQEFWVHLGCDRVSSNFSCVET